MYIRHRLMLARQGFSLILLSAILILSALGLSRCRMVNDTVTGVNVESNATFGGARSACEKQCNQEFKRCKTEEEHRYRMAKDLCQQLPSARRKACLKTEARRHKDELYACKDLKNACKRACRYQEGSGSGGR